MVEYSEEARAKATVISEFLTEIDFYHLIYPVRMILSKCADDRELSWWFCQCVKFKKI